MTAIITGDIINSSEGIAPNFLVALKKSLNLFGKNPTQWEIFRGDSFQLETTPEMAFEAALKIKLGIKQLDGLDVRMAIGIGEKDFAAPKITESNGSAFVHSGKSFEGLKKQTLAFKSPWETTDEMMNLMFEMASLTTDNWTGVSAFVIEKALQNPEMRQSDLAKKIGKSQSNISDALNRGGYYSLLKLNEFYKKEIQRKCSSS